MKNIGIILIIAGLIMVFVTGFNLVTKKKVVDLGPLEINKEENHPVQWSPVIGIAVLIGGVLIFVTNRNKK